MSSPTPNYTSKLQGQRVLIIGGSSGVGFGIAEALLANGASVIISSSSAERVARAVERLETSIPPFSSPSSPTVQGFSCDLSSPTTLESEVSNLFAQLAHSPTKTPTQLDHIIFTAGDSLHLGPIESFTLAQIQQAGMVRFFAPLIVAKHLRAHLRPGPQSSYTLTTAGSTEHLNPHWAAVHSFLAGINGMARSLAVEMAPIRVNAVGLGAIDTELWDGIKRAGKFEELEALVRRKATTGRMGRVQDAVEAYLYLLKDWNCAGTTVVTHGGIVTM